MDSQLAALDMCGTDLLLFMCRTISAAGMNCSRPCIDRANGLHLTMKLGGMFLCLSLSWLVLLSGLTDLSACSPPLKRCTTFSNSEMA